MKTRKGGRQIVIMGGNVKFISIIIVVRGIGIKLKDEWEEVEVVG